MAEKKGRTGRRRPTAPRDDAASPAPAAQVEQLADRVGDAAVRVLAAVIHRGGRWLVCKRPSHKRHGGLWEFPGGKLEEGESLLDGARRELGEELAVRVVGAGDVRFSRRDSGSVFVIEFVDVEIDGEPEAIEHDEVRWATAPELTSLDLAPSDRVFVERVLLASR